MRGGPTARTRVRLIKARIFVFDVISQVVIIPALLRGVIRVVITLALLGGMMGMLLLAPMELRVRYLHLLSSRSLWGSLRLIVEHAFG
jgi:hypothetical protein